MWSSSKVGKGSASFYSSMEEQLKKQIYKVKDEEFQQLISCITTDKNDSTRSDIKDFSQNFLKIVLGVIDQKKDSF